jgi:DNA-binding NarL/FixJ family response regulator
MIGVGAVCHIAKSVSPNEMITNINLVIQNGFHFKDEELHYIEENSDKTKTIFDKDFFTKREFQVLQLICQQKTAAEIAATLKISTRTVDGFRASLLTKTKSKNSIGLIIFAVKNRFFAV